jgi:iron complex outermembrane receptor protein
MMSKRFAVSKPQKILGVGAMVAALLAGATVAQAADTDDGGALEEITVFGHGESRQESALLAADIAAAAPGTSALKVIDKLPGVSFQSSDPFGSYEWSTRISVRGFNQNQLGFTLDGVPLGDMSYGNHNGLHISRAIASENIARSVLSQGAGSLATASSSNLGGTLEFYSRDPAKQAGAEISLTGGSNSDRHAFVRLESGELAGAGTRGYLSFTDQKADKWKGQGQQKQRQANLKIVQPIGAATLTGFYNWSDRQENDYQDLSLEMVARLGYNWDNISNNWPLMVSVARAYQGETALPAPFATVDDAYANASGLRVDRLYGLTLNLPVAEGVDWNTTAYGHTNNGQGTWFTPYVPTPAGAPDGKGGTISSPAPISVRTTEYGIDRKGLLSAIDWKLGAQRLAAGLWYEKNDFHQARRFYGLQLAAPQRDSLQFMRDPFFTQWEYQFSSRTMQFFVQDTWEVTDALKVNAGFKSLSVRNEGARTVNNGAAVGCDGSVICGTIEAKKGFLPQLGFNYRFDTASELFGDVTRNMRAFVAAGTGSSPFATTLTGFNGIKDTLQPETSTTWEMGYRYNAGSVQAVATAYYVNFKDRLLAFAPGSGIQGNPTVLQNVGRVETKGAELGIKWSVATNWNWYNSLSFNSSTYQDDVLNGNGTIAVQTKGKHVVDAPATLFKSEFGYDDSQWFAKLGLDHTDKRYFTYTNDLVVAGDGGGSVPAYTVLDLAAGWHGRDFGSLKQLDVQLNVSNLADKQYLSTIGSNGFGNSGDNQTFLTAAPRQVFVTVTARF